MRGSILESVLTVTKKSEVRIPGMNVRRDTRFKSIHNQLEHPTPKVIVV